MIEVIKDNTKEKFFTLCETCLSELIYTYDDVVMKDLEFNYMPDKHITCPVCHKDTFADLQTKDKYEFKGGHFKATSPLFANICNPPLGFNSKD